MHLLETLKQKDVEVRVDPDCSVRLACPPEVETRLKTGQEEGVDKKGHLYWKTKVIDSSSISKVVMVSQANSIT